MRKVVFITVMCAFVATPALADMISFVDSHPLDGVDGPPLDYDGTVDWSTGDGLAGPLAHSYDLLGGRATVAAFHNGTSDVLSHRLTRGLGVYGYEDDEVNRIEGINDPEEHIDITFVMPYYVHEIEVRSLFMPDTHNNVEWAAIDFYYNNPYTDLNSSIPDSTVYLSGIEALYASGTKGVQSWSPTTPVLVNTLVFRVPTIYELPNAGTISINCIDYCYDPLLSEFAVAELTVTPVPVPAAVILGILGLGVAGFKLRKYA